MICATKKTLLSALVTTVLSCGPVIASDMQKIEGFKRGAFVTIATQPTETLGYTAILGLLVPLDDSREAYVKIEDRICDYEFDLCALKGNIGRLTLTGTLADGGEVYVTFEGPKTVFSLKWDASDEREIPAQLTMKWGEQDTKTVAVSITTTGMKASPRMFGVK